MATKVRVILDRSGSMWDVAEDTVQRFNEYIATVDRDRGEEVITVSLYQFDDKYQVDYKDVPVSEVEKLKLRETYQPRGGTALLDAIGKTMVDVDLNEDDKGLCVILTDGYENSSTEHTNESVATLIKDLEDNKNWKFVYLGANQDAFAVANRFGIRDVGNTISYGNNSRGVARSFESLTSNTVAYAATPVAAAPSMEFFSQEDREEAEKTKE